MVVNSPCLVTGKTEGTWYRVWGGSRAGAPWAAQSEKEKQVVGGQEAWVPDWALRLSDPMALGSHRASQTLVSLPYRDAHHSGQTVQLGRLNEVQQT